MDAFFAKVAELWGGLPRPVAAVIVLAAGWGAAILLRLLCSRLLAAMKFDKFSERTGLKEFLRKGGVEYSPSRLVGVILYWIVIIVVLILSALALDVRIVDELSGRIAAQLPAILSAALVTGVGLVLVGFLANFAATISRNAGFPSARLLSRIIRWAGYVFIVSIALDQMGIGRNLVGPVFLIVLGAVALGAAIAFGFGCKDMAREAMDRFIRTMMERSRDGGGGDMEG
jgi:hypothetical protein